MPPSLTLVSTVYTPAQLRDAPLDAPQVALAGRSNVGKSSLINRLAGAKKLAKISATPGKTRSINFYRVEPDGYYLVDLPGYGYARTSKVERAKWAELIEKYLADAPGLKAVAVLLDSRLDPQALDMEMVSWLRQSGVPALAVLTKADKCSQRDLARRQSQWRDLMRSTVSPLLFSAVSGKGTESLWKRLREACDMPAADDAAVETDGGTP
ncbi:GTP-binding protein engB [Desulfovibrio sp. X2]|uniref:ribosome biogenesis GTP-binding protein YihA/YsxC n=1 Tax=Desulfovibrio sp. X2 TaxID=941449 RepID=UPI000358E882|nr:ribosome biogenesis GTP-binding protein YihA/YsxC [Desulfovibrio sp. X2]EPR42275.1 GTP-binding protein engB [Desulfovibrio sp. X2]